MKTDLPKSYIHDDGKTCKLPTPPKDSVKRKPAMFKKPAAAPRKAAKVFVVLYP